MNENTEGKRTEGELKQLTEELEDRVRERTREVSTFRNLAENAIDAIVIGSPEGKITFSNRACCEIFGYDYETGEMVGMPIANFWPDKDVPVLTEEVMPQAIAAGSWQGEVKQKRKDGILFDVSLSVFGLRSEAGEIMGVTAIIRDITERKQMEEERERLQQRIIESQEAVIRELATPIMPIYRGIVVLPLVGTIDTRRAQQIMQTMLTSIASYQASVVIMDITGVPVMDTGVANHLLQVARAARLLGSEVIIVGIRPEVAQTIVHLGVDLSGMMTKQNLQRGLEYAFQAMELQIVRREENRSKARAAAPEETEE